MNTSANNRLNDWQRTNWQRVRDYAKLWVRTIRNDTNLLRDAHRAAWLMVILVAVVVVPMRVPGWLALIGGEA